MTVNLKRTVEYKWVPRDAVNALKKPPSPRPEAEDKRWADYQDRKLTPYGFMIEVLPNAAKHKDGDKVSIDLRKSIMSPEVQRFGAFPADVDWLPLSKEAEGETTLGALCLKLYTLGTTTMVEKYGGIYDAYKDYTPDGVVTPATQAARVHLACAISDQWDNTDWRHAVVTAGGFDWTQLASGPWKLKTEASGQRVKSVPTNVPLIKAVPVAPIDPCKDSSTQNVVIDPALEARLVLAHIKEEAKKGAKLKRTVSTGSKFYKRLTDFYLNEYLAAPSPELGLKAIGLIGEKFTDPPFHPPLDRWERLAITTWNDQPLPPGLREIRPDLPEKLEAATEILNQLKRKALPTLDIDHLLGPENLESTPETDFTNGGKNESHLMHWATGVKYHHHGERDLREVFLGYEMWHMEGWDVFGDDSINDMIVEDAGRILGDGLKAGTITAGNLQGELDTGFAGARAWVGSLLRVRHGGYFVQDGRTSSLKASELDAWVLQDKQRPTVFHWNPAKQQAIWGTETVKSMLAKGSSRDEVKKSDLVQRIIGIYTLVYEVDEWEAANTPIDNTKLIQSLLEHKFDVLLSKLGTGKEITSTDAQDALGAATDEEDEDEDEDDEDEGSSP